MSTDQQPANYTRAEHRKVLKRRNLIYYIVMAVLVLALLAAIILMNDDINQLDLSRYDAGIPKLIERDSLSTLYSVTSTNRETGEAEIHTFRITIYYRTIAGEDTQNPGKPIVTVMLLNWDVELINIVKPSEPTP